MKHPVCRQVYRKVIKQGGMQVSKQAYWGQDMKWQLAIIINVMQSVNLNQSKAQFQLELSLAQFSPSLFQADLALVSDISQV